MSDPTALPTFGFPTDVETSLKDRVTETLTNMGGEFEIDADGDIQIVVEDQALFIRTMEAGLSFMRIFGQWHISDEMKADHLGQLAIASDLSTRLNLIKVGIVQHDAPEGSDEEPTRLLVSAADLVVSPDTDLQPIIGQSIFGIMQAVGTWHEAANGTPIEEALQNQAERLSQANEAEMAEARRQAEEK